MARLSMLLPVALLAWPIMLCADVITLKDGTQVEGEIKRAGDCFIVKEPAGTVKTVQADSVARIEMKPASTADAAMGRLQSLRRAADNLPDLKQVIDRYKAFIDQNSQAPIGDLARADLKMWQDRLDRGLVKVGEKWVTPAERDELQSRSTDIAIALHDLLKAGKLKEAGPRLDAALQIDPHNASLLYLRGVSQYQQEFLPPARKSFEAVIAAAPDHAPTLNNLGVILWRQNAHSAALGYYDRAMIAAPVQVDILNNVAEALNALPKEQRESTVAKKVVRHFKEQDDALQKKMAETGQYRWGSSWVSEKELKNLHEQEKTINTQIAQLQQDFDAIQTHIKSIDRQIPEISNEMAIIDAQTYANGPNNTIVRLPYPPLYFTLGQQLAALKADRADRVDELERLRKSARQAQAQLPTPKFTGIQHLIDADGVPLPAGVKIAPPATMSAPTTQPGK